MSLLSEIVEELKFNIAYRKRLMPAQKELNTNAPKMGDMAPDFTLNDVEGQNSVTLSNFRGKKPVALVFGSFT
jgi:peroxiredoxin